MFRLYPRTSFLNDPTRSKTVHDERKTNDKVLSKTIPVQPTTSTNGVPDDSRPTDTQVDLDKLAYAVAMAETKNCTVGVGKSQLNCFGIRNGNTAPCKKEKNRFCVYDDPKESYEAFKIIWERWYGGLPNIQKAKKWTATQPHEWLANVLHIYHNS